MNGFRIKLKNRRVQVFKDGQDLYIDFIKLDTEPAHIIMQSNKCRHWMRFTLSIEAGHALYQLLGETIRLSDLEGDNEPT